MFTLQDLFSKKEKRNMGTSIISSILKDISKLIDMENNHYLLPYIAKECCCVLLILYAIELGVIWGILFKTVILGWP